MIKFLDLQKQYLSIQDEIDRAIKEVIQSSAFIGGSYVESFEKDFANFTQTQFCIGVGNGTDALEIAIEALGLQKGSEILVPANSFIASSEAITRCGHKIIFVDCEDDYLISVKTIKKVVTSNTKALILVHLYGQACQMDSILEFTTAKNIKIIEDCAQAHGATFQQQKVGSFGNIATFSFYPGKNLGAYGDGGAIVTNNKTLAEQARLIANHGRSSKYFHTMEGRNSRLDGLQAAILSVKLKYLPLWLEKRNSVASYYLEHIKNPHIILPKVHVNSYHAWHLFVIRTDNSQGLKDYLDNNQVQSGVHYPLALPKLEAYNYHKQNCDDFFASQEDAHLLSLPIGEHLEMQEVKLVVDLLNKYKG